ncbi:MAG TPA: glycosyltransferase family 4 protein [Candidatus Polarisedimenticolaceae bacterium]|nr:glycosyltransferase family 4 protein [Candidatus Polarisedimenticolaceae bacterium]
MGGSGHSRLLKILHIDPEKNWGGGEAQVVGLLQNLSQWGHRNDLATPADGELFRRSLSRVRKIPLSVRNDLDVRGVPALRRLIRQERYDIVHLHTKRAHALSLWLPRGELSPKYIVTRRMDYPEPKNCYTRYLYNRRVDGVVAISRSVVNCLSEAGVNRRSIRLIYSGIDPVPFRGLVSDQSANDPPVIGMLAVLEQRKGHRFLLDAARLLKDRGRRIRYVFAGDGSHKAQLQSIVQTLGLQEEVSFVGFVQDVPEFLCSINVLVLPSLYEGLGVAALEAMAAGKPVVATRVGGLAESIIDGETGFLVPPQNAVALADAIERLVADPAMARAMGRKGAARVLSNFTTEQMATQNEAYYYALLDGTS